jgi:proline iminopeptidase
VNGGKTKNIMYWPVFLFLIVVLNAACEQEDWVQPGALVPYTVDQDSSIPSLEINGTLLHVESFGDPKDPLLIVIHGGPGGDFRSLLNAKGLAEDGFHTVFYDQRGTGLSKREDKSQFEGPDAVQSFIDDLDALVEHFKIDENQKVFLLGHSWGAMLATAYINEYPQKVNGAILAEPGGLSWPQAKDYLSRSNDVKFFEEAINDMLFPEQMFAGRTDHEILDYKASFSANFENAPGNTIGNPGHYPFWRSGAIAAKTLGETADKYGFDFRTNLSEFTTEILFLYSENNKAYGAGWAEIVSAPFPNADVQMIKNSGHEMLYFGWTDMYPQTLNYLNQFK